jgi:hypothetical protein
MVKNSIILFIVVVATSLFYLLFSLEKSQSSALYGTTRIVLVPLDIGMGSESVLRGKIDKLNSFLDTNTTIQRPVIFVESNEQNKEQMSSRQYNLVEQLLLSIKSNPIFVFGKNFSRDHSFDFALGARYGKISITPEAGPQVNIIQVDSNDLFSDFILKFTHRISNTDAPGLALYNNGEPQKQFNWLSSLVGATSDTNILITQIGIDEIDNNFRQILLDVVCSSRISLFVYMSKQENEFRTRLCPGNSFAMLGAPKHFIGFLGLQTDDAENQKFRYATIDIGQNGADITYRIL